MPGPKVHPKLRGKLENWKASEMEEDNSGGNNATATVGFLSKSAFFHEDVETVLARSKNTKATPPTEIIHSGHFMVSEIEEESGESEDSSLQDKMVIAVEEECSVSVTDSADGGFFREEEQSLVVDNRKIHQSGGSNMSSSAGSYSHRKSITIDGSLTKLFKHMSLAYSGKITSPKWKQFSGLKMMLKDKIRLNNVIWRAWHIQYIKIQKPIVSMFATPLDLEEDHQKPQAVVLEGKYWKRRLGAIVEEYKKWRQYFRSTRNSNFLDVDAVIASAEESSNRSNEHNLFDDEMMELLDRVDWEVRKTPVCHSAIAGTVASPNATVDGDFMQMMDFTDTLFQTLQYPFAFPDPREIAQAASNADVIQPGLVQLQPTLDDFIPDFSDMLTPAAAAVPMPQPPMSLFPKSETFLNEIPIESAAPMISQSIPMQSMVSHENSEFLQSQEMTFPCNNVMIVDAGDKSCQNWETGLVDQQGSTAPVPITFVNAPTVDNNNSLTVIPNVTLDDAGRGCLILPKPDAVAIAQDSGSASVGQTPEETAVTFLVEAPSSCKESLTTQTEPPSSYCGSELLVNLLKTESPGFGATLTKVSEAIAEPNNSVSVEFSMPITPNQTVPVNSVVPIPPAPPFNGNLSSGIPKPFHRQFPLQGSLVGTVPNSRSTTPSPTPLSTFTSHLSPLIVAPLNTTMFQTVQTTPQARPLSSNASTPSPGQSDVHPKPVRHSSSDTPTSTPTIADLKRGDDGSWGGPSASKRSKVQDCASSSHSCEGDAKTQRRQKVHVSSEQKRRGNINSGFEMLQRMIPSMNPNLKVSKAQTLQKTTEYLTKLKTEREQRKAELHSLKAEAEAHSRCITECQNALPATGVSFSHLDANSKEEQGKFLWKLYHDYVRSRTLVNWKFWILSKLLTPLFDAYVAAVTGLSSERTEELVEALQRWMERHCSLTALRPMIMNALRKLSTTTGIINRPDRLPQEAVADVKTE